MSCKYICDGCGKEESGYYNGLNWFEPHTWYAKNTEDKKCIHACSRSCIKIASEKYKTHDVVLPV